MGRRGVICLLLIGAICAALPIAAAATDVTVRATYDPELVEDGFVLHGTHGYLIGVTAYSDAGHGPRINVSVARAHDSASYETSGSVTAEGIHADLGGLGRIDLDFHPSGGERTAHSRCGGGSVTYQPGSFEGVFEFNGEQGYTRARTDRVALTPPWLLILNRFGCGSSGHGEAISSQEPGARLRGISYAHGRRLAFQVNKNRPQGKAVFTASLAERRNGMKVFREASGVAPSSTFRYDKHLRTASLGPGGGFLGSASLRRSSSSVSPIWTGDLRLDFPGHEVPLAGPGVYVNLLHARFTTSGDHSTAEIGF
jgi:hypothetical protein